MAMLQLSTVIGAIVDLGVEGIWEKAKRREAVIAVLKKIGLQPHTPPSDFDGVYAYTLVEYGVGKPKPILDFFRHEFIREAFRQSFENQDPSILNQEADGLIEWHTVGEDFRQMDVHPRREFARFTAVFNEVVDRTRTPAEVRQDYKLDAIRADLHHAAAEITQRLDRLEQLDDIRAEIYRLLQAAQARHFVVAPTGDKLKVFISSKMMELRDVRECVANALDDRGIEAWVYEAHAGARPADVVDTSLREVEAADIYVGLFWQRYGDVTVQEYRHARALGKPCFVYIRDKDIEREKALEGFLHAQVYDLQRGVTYDYFDSALRLGQQVADDITAWLVRRHREMTAEIQQSRVSQGEIARLQAEVDRLQAASRHPLPPGTPVDYLAQQMTAWFDTLGYRFESHDVRTEIYFEWIIDIPTRRGYDRILVRGIDGEAEISDVVALRHVVDEQAADEGWLVAARRKSQAACEQADRKENRDLFCYTFDELLDERADFSGYLDWLEDEVKRRGIDWMYVPLACRKEELDPITNEPKGVSHYNERNGWIDGYIDRWLDDPAKEHVSILGEFGTGKTWFALHYAWAAAQRYRDAKERGIQRPRLPLVIPLRDYAKAVSLESLFSEFFFRKHEIPLPGYSAFEQLNRMGKLLLIFDGFDEMAARVDRQKMINNFWELARVVVPGSKVILTCRTEHFPEAKEGRALLSAELQASTAKLTREPPQFEVLELEKLNDAQIRQVLSFRASPTTVERVMANRELSDLASRPIMTEYILDALPDIEIGKPVDLSRVYLYAVRRKMERDIKADRTFTSLADKLYFLCELSWEMLSTDRLSLNYRLFPDRLRRLFGPAVQEQKDLDHWHYDMMGQTMLIRNADGDYTPAHRSLLEFFVAYKFAAEMGALAPDFTELAQAQEHLDESATPQNYTWSAYFRRELDETGEIVSIPPLQSFACEPMENLAETVGKQKLAPAVLNLTANMVMTESLWSVIEATRVKSADQCGYSGGNAISVISCLEKNLQGCDLSSTKLIGAHLSNVDLSNAVFRDADLTEAHLSAAYLKHTDFTGARLGGVTVGNPYMFRGAVSGRCRSEWICKPRAHLLQSIAQSISQGEHLAIVSLRRMGRTSLALHLLHLIADSLPGSAPYYIDPQTWGPQDINLLQLIQHHVVAQGWLKDDFTEAVRKPIQAVTSALVADTRSSGKRLVLILDEADVLLYRRDHLDQYQTAFDFLQTLSDSDALVTVAIFTRFDHLSQMADIHPFFKRHRVRFLGAFDEVSAREWLIEGGYRTGVEYTSEALALISKLTGNWPNLMQVFCSVLLEELHQSKPDVLPTAATQADVETAIDNVLHMGRAHLQFLSDALPSEWTSILKALVENDLPLGEIQRATAIPRDELRLTILPELVGNSLLRETDGVYSISAELVRMYLASTWT